jgi:Cu-Zn family superoxide dismutase
MSCANAIASFYTKNVKGYITFHQCKNRRSTNVKINLYNLKSNSVNAIHIHEYGDKSDGCISLGSHWNPKNTTHGSIIIDMDSHAGDMINNIHSNSRGEFNYEYEDNRIKLRGNVNQSIIGRSIVIHEGEDDLGLGNNIESKKTGNAGKRLECSVIGHARDGKELFSK